MLRLKKSTALAVLFFAEKKENLRSLNLDFIDIVKDKIHDLRLL